MSQRCAKPLGGVAQQGFEGEEARNLVVQRVLILF